MRQSGLLFKYSPTDYVTGASPIPVIEVNPSGDWRDYLPTEERQSKDFTFDTMSCTTFSALNIVETTLNFLLKNKKISLVQELLFADYIVDGKFNFSDRFTAIMSNTTKQGNYFQSVWDSIRKDGLLPEKDLPFGGDTWEQYHDKSLITDEMKTKAKKILELIDVAYEWVSLDPANSYLIEDAVKHAPIHGAIPFPGTHAIMLPESGYIFDTYNPFLYKNKKPIHYSMKGIVSIKTTQTQPVTEQYKYFSPKEIIGLKPELVRMLDKARGLAGIPFVINSGYRTKDHNSSIDGAAQDSSHLRGLGVDIRCRNSTERHKIVKACLDVGFTRWSDRYPSHVHVDCDTSLPQNVAW